MDQKKLLNADYLDIIFDNRNKAYGGYELRKNYDRRVKKGVAFLMLGVSAIASFSFIRMDKPKNVATPFIACPTIVNILPPTPPPPKSITPPPPPAPPAVQMTKFNQLTVTPDNEVKPEETLTEVNNIKNPGIRNVDTGSAESIMPPGDGDRRVAVVTEPTGKPGLPTFVEQMPQFPGNMQYYLASHINYPAAAREANIQGRVGITFVVNEDGTITDAKVARGIGGGCDEEALRVIRAMPKWKPGKQNGVALKVLFTQVITFRLE